MARGWESKAVESQQDEAQRGRTQAPALTPAEREAASRRASLELALASTQAELQAACRPAHRDMLRLKLAAIQAELGAMGR